MPLPMLRKSPYTAGFVVPVCLYLVLLTLFSWNHVLWGDEGQAWLLARDSPTFLSVFHNVRYEGHPPLWHLVLWGITRFTRNPEWMKVANALFAAISAVLILGATKVPLYARIGTVFSYFMLFEYSLINRNYMLGIMLLLLAVRCLEEARAIWRVPLLLGFAALSSLPALVVAVVLYGLHATLVLRSTTADSPLKRWLSLGYKRYAAAALFALCVGASLVVISRPADSGVTVITPYWRGGQIFLRDVSACFRFVATAFIPIPHLHVPFWNNPLTMQAPLFLSGAAGLLLAVFLVFFFRQKPVRCFYAIASTVIIGQAFFTARARMRHVGWLFVIFVLGLLLEQTFSTTASDQPSRWSWRDSFVAGLLSVQVFAAVVALSLSARYPFSQSRNAATYIRQHFNDVPILAPSGMVNAILPYLHQQSAYYPERHGQGSFVIGTATEFTPRAIDRADFLAATLGGIRPLLVVQGPLDAQDMVRLGVREQAAFTAKSCRDERFYLYR